jgi:hypothetical protein
MKLYEIRIQKVITTQHDTLHLVPQNQAQITFTVIPYLAQQVKK